MILEWVNSVGMNNNIMTVHEIAHSELAEGQRK